MKIHRFFSAISIPEAGDFTVADETLLNQWRNVLRFGAGDNLVVFDGSGDEVLCELNSLNKKEATLHILEYRRGLKPSREVTLFMSLIKRDNFELVLEKATELGVSRIVPVEAARSEKKGVNYERCEKILREAAEQSGRATVPILEDTIGLADVLKEYQIPLIVLDPRGDAFKEEIMESATGFLVGPEGGFTEEEISLFREQNIPIISVGPTVLRAETAAIVVLALALTR